MAVTYADSGTFAAAVGAVIYPAFMATINAGDYLIVAAWSRRSSGTQVLTGPSGWGSPLATRASNNLTYAIWGKVADGTETGLVSVTSLYYSLPMIGRMCRFVGVDNATPTKNPYTQASTSRNQWTTGARAVDFDGSMVIYWPVSADNIAAADDGTYYAEQTDDASALGSRAMLAMYTLSYDAGTSPADVISSSVYPTNDYSGGMGTVLNPAVEQKVLGVSWSDVGKVMGVAKANISKVIGV